LRRGDFGPDNDDTGFIGPWNLGVLNTEELETA